MVEHAFNPSTWGGSAGSSLSLVCRASSRRAKERRADSGMGCSERIGVKKVVSSSEPGVKSQNHRGVSLLPGVLGYAHCIRSGIVGLGFTREQQKTLNSREA